MIDSRLTEILEVTKQAFLPMVMFISTQVLAQSKDCQEMGILSDSSEKVNHCGINSQQIAVQIGQISMHFITS